VAIVTADGRVTLPERVREALGLEPGAEVEFDIRDGEAVIRRRMVGPAIERWRGYLRGRVAATSTDELLADLRGE